MYILLFSPLLFMLVLKDLPCLYLYTALSFLFYSTVLAVTFAVNVASYCSLIQTISIRPCQNKRLSSSQSLYLHIFCHNASSFCYCTQFSYCFSLFHTMRLSAHSTSCLWFNSYHLSTQKKSRPLPLSPCPICDSLIFPVSNSLYHTLPKTWALKRK